MAVASLPMYDLPELRGAHAALCARIARHLQRAGVTDLPAALCQERPAGEVWADPELLLSQCCGADLTGAFAGALRVVATPCYRAPGCAGPAYASLVVVAEDSDILGLEDLRGRVASINHPGSHSGMNALRALIAPLSHEGRFFSAVKVSGAHDKSLAMVARGEAEVAAIDCVTHALLARHRPAALAGTRVLCHTASAPAPPYVTRADADDDLMLRLRAALGAALVDPTLRAAREELLLDDVETLRPSAYRRIPAFARLAAGHGYATLC
jgi:ABC-type phosphate/phosphonate transport system substrate-binding protein